MAIELVNMCDSIAAYMGPVPPGLQQQMVGNNFGSSHVSQQGPMYEESTRLGNAFCMRNYTAKTSVNAIPTTGVGCGFWNGSPAKAMVLDKLVLVTAAVDASQANGHSIWFNLAPAGTAKPTAVVASGASLSCKAVIDNLAANIPGSAVICATTITVAAPWLPLPMTGDTGSSAAGSIWRMQCCNIDGEIIIPPTGQIAFETVSLAAVASSCYYNLFWHEEPMILG